MDSDSDDDREFDEQQLETARSKLAEARRKDNKQDISKYTREVQKYEQKLGLNTAASTLDPAPRAPVAASVLTTTTEPPRPPSMYDEPHCGSNQG